MRQTLSDSFRPVNNLILFERIARERSDIRTLRTRRHDSLDFHDVSVWALLDMMQSAYDAGFKAGAENREEPR
jgi:hypothetical protein